LTAGEAAPSARELGRVNGDLTLVDLLGSPMGRRLGVLLGAPAAPDGYAVYAEVRFPIPGVSLRDEAAFSDLDYAVYLGGVARSSSMLFGTVDEPIEGERTTASVPVGNSALLVEATPRRPLTGELAGALPWLVLAVGLVGTTSGAAAIETIGRRRDVAVRAATALAQQSDELLVAKTQLAELNATLEQQVEHRTTELQAVNRELESFAYAVSHDLRAPLRAIDGFGLALVEDYGDRLDDQGRDYARRVRAATQRMGELIDDLLTLSRVTRAELHREPVDLSAVARSVAARLAEADPERKVDVAVAEGLTARGDARLLRVALENLLGNAWKFTENRPSPHIEFGAREEAGTKVFFVRDNGVGFDPQFAHRTFSFTCEPV
jgi:signal transduction histidine kinase